MPFLEKLIEVARALKRLVPPAMKASPEHWKPIDHFADLDCVSEFLAGQSATFGKGNAQVTLETQFERVRVAHVVRIY